MTDEQADPTAGWDLMLFWDDAQPWDIIYDGELWSADRETNWDYENGRPLHIPEGADILESFHVPAQLLPGYEEARRELPRF